ELVLLHIWQVDEAQHHEGLWSPAAIRAIENADQQLARVFAAVSEAGIASETAFVIASDHGFTHVSRQYHPAALLREAGLITLDDKGKPTSYRASVSVNGGSAYVYLRDDRDGDLERKARALFESRAGKPGSGIGRVLDREQLRARGADPTAAFALEAEADAYFGSNLQAYETAAGSHATHGYDPQRADMQASLLWIGPGVRPGRREGTRLVDIAPTIARWLGLTLPDTDGRALD
ncbi:MAG TPA: alkaline phosphatase family protein, partial [Polyangiales bacterium]